MRALNARHPERLRGVSICGSHRPPHGGITMKRSLVSALMFVAFAGAPATAQTNAGGLAKTVVGNGAVLQRGADTCANGLALSEDDQLAITLARQAAQSALPATQYLTLTATANSNAITASEKQGFCAQTLKKKASMMKAIREATKKLSARRLGS